MLIRIPYEVMVSMFLRARCYLTHRIGGAVGSWDGDTCRLGSARSSNGKLEARHVESVPKRLDRPRSDTQMATH